MNNISRIKNLLIFLLLLFSIPSFSQLIKEQFTHPEFIEDFDADKGNWPIFTNADNLFVIQNGEYILNRKNSFTQYATLTEWENQLESFDLFVNLKIVQANDDNSNIGVIIMAQSKGGGFVIELNKNLQYRVKQLNGSTYQYISGNENNNGWVKSPDIKSVGKYNIIEVKSSNKNYDIFINGSFQMSFTEKNYTYGRMGVVIGPNTNGLVDYFYVYSNQKYTTHKTTNNTSPEKKNMDTPTPLEPSTDMVSILSETVVRLKTQINKLTKENEDLKRQVSSLDNSFSPPANGDTTKLLDPQETKQLIALYESSKTTNDSLKNLLYTYKKIQEMLSGNENGDIIISLTNSAKNEKVQNDLLTQKNKILKDSMAYYRTLYNKFKPNTSKSNTANKLPTSPNKPVKDTTAINNKKTIIPKNK